MSVATAVVDTVKGLFTNHDGLVKQREELLAKHEAAVRARQVEIDKLKARVEEWKKPERDLAAAEAAALGAANLEQRALATLERELEKHQTPEHARFATFLERLYERIRAMEPPRVQEEINRRTDTRRITNLDELERWLTAVSGPRDPERPGHRLPSALALAMRACGEELWPLPAEAQRARITELRRALEESFVGTVLERELG